METQLPGGSGRPDPKQGGAIPIATDPSSNHWPVAKPPESAASHGRRPHPHSQSLQGETWRRRLDAAGGSACHLHATCRDEQGRDFSLYVDEFQNFATESFATILSEARKYRLHLIIANQYLAQMEEQTAGAVFGNVGSLLCFQVGARDAEILAEQLGGDVTPQDLIALPRFTAYLRLLLDGMPSRAFSMETLPPRRRRPADRNRPAIIRRTSRRRYARPAREVVVEIEHVFAVA
jgi:hypothetical protein